MKKYGIKKENRLKSKKIITDLFSTGKSVFIYPVKLVYKTYPHSSQNDVDYQYGVSVSKRLYKKAVHRNKIKRCLREAHRLNNAGLSDAIPEDCRIVLMYIYVGKSLDDLSKLMGAVPRLYVKLKEELV